MDLEPREEMFPLLPPYLYLLLGPGVQDLELLTMVLDLQLIMDPAALSDI